MIQSCPRCGSTDLDSVGRCYKHPTVDPYPNTRTPAPLTEADVRRIVHEMLTQFAENFNKELKL